MSLAKQWAGNVSLLLISLKQVGEMTREAVARKPQGREGDGLGG